MDYILQLLKLMTVLLVFIAITYFIVKKLKTRQFKQLSQNNMLEIVDGINLGMNQTMYLVKIGKEEYALVSMGSNGIDMMPLKQTEIIDPKNKFDEALGVTEPTDKMEQLKNKLKEGLGRK